jgi:iron complex outermembrane receptor protein
VLFIPLEDKERVEVLSGVDGFLYGTGSVGGNINYVLKRPTAAPYYSVTAGDNAGANGYIHGDFGGPQNIPGLADGLIGYRLNIVEQGGHTSIYNQSIQRDLISGAFDIHLPYDILLQLNAEHSNYHVWGITPSFNVNTSINPYLASANPSNVFSPPWTQSINQTDTGGLKLTWKLNDIFTIRAAYAFTREDQPSVSASLSQSITNSQGLLRVRPES